MSSKYENPHEELLERLERPLGMSPSQILQLFKVRTKDDSEQKQEYAVPAKQYDLFSSKRGK